MFIGGNMVHEAFEEDEENSKETAQFDWKHMLPLGRGLQLSMRSPWA